MKVRSKAPLRLGFGGGGTDVSPFCDEYGGYVLNATINKFAYCTIDDNVYSTELISPDIDESANIYGEEELIPADNSRCRLLRGVYHSLIKRGYVTYKPLKITTYSDVPGGSGLGSSSTMIVAIIQAFHEYFNLTLGEYDLAGLAWEIERTDLGLKGGKQDQFCAAFGGWNFMEFYKNSTIVNPLRIKEHTLNELESSIMICFTGTSRSSSEVIEQQVKSMKEPDSIEALKDLKQSALDMKNMLLKSDINGFAEVLNQSWANKKRTSKNISNENIDLIYETALANGAKAGKLSGAGASGFMMFIVEPELKLNVSKALTALGLHQEPILFYKKGAISWKIRN